MKNKILTALLSLLISFGLWLYVMTVIGPESEVTIYDVPVQLVEADHLADYDLIITSDTQELQMDVTLRGQRSDLNKLTKSNITIFANASKIRQSGEQELECTISFTSGTAEVVGKKPESVTINVEKLERKSVPVVYTKNALPEGYGADISLKETMVEVKGPRALVNQISYAQITVNLPGQEASYEAEYALTLYDQNAQPLSSSQNVTTNISKVKAEVQVYRAKQVDLILKVDYTDSGLPENGATVDASVSRLTLTGSEEALAKVGSAIEVTVKLSNYKESTVDVLQLELPEGVKCKDEVKVEIKLPDMKSRTLTLSERNFRFINAPAGTAVSLNRSVQIQIYGPAEVLDALTVENVVATVDCSDLKVGTSVVTATYEVKGHTYLLIAEKGAVSVIVTGSGG